MCSCDCTDTDIVFLQTDFFHFANISYSDTVCSVHIDTVNKQEDNIIKKLRLDCALPTILYGEPWYWDL